jgi:hypothetical protein
MNKFIQNIGDYFSSNYFDEDFTAKVVSKTGYAAEDVKDFNKRISPLKDRYFRFKQLFIEEKLRIKDKVFESHRFHTEVLNALGYDGSHHQYDNLFHLSEHEVIPVRHILYRGEQVHLMVMEMQALIKEDDEEPDGLFEQSYNVEIETQINPPQRYHRLQWEKVFTVPEGLKISPVVINKAVSELFLMEQHLRPKYILLLAGNMVFLLEQEKWFRGSYLQIDLEELFSEATASRNANYYALFYFLLGKETLTPDSNMVLLDQLDEDSHKSAYEVTKDLKEGIIHAVEALANEALFYMKQVLHEDFDESDDTFEHQIKDDCLTIIYRMLFIFYAESREDLDILPGNDPIYNKGYSLEMLRDLEQVPLYSDSSLNGYFFHESLSVLFELLSSGYRERETAVYDKEQIATDNDIKINKSFKVRHIDSPLFNNQRLKHLHKVKFRNKVWQDIICRLSLSRQQRGRARGRISYANLGINQLGSVYESLLAYRGFYAEQDYIEVHKADKPNEGTYLVPRMRRDDFNENEILKDENGHDAIIKKGTFVYRLSGRDRQKSASYYTPEVLTQCTVKYTLKPILEKLDKGEMKALELLALKLLEPAMGAAAFHNEMINQLAEAYLNYRQKELRDAGRVEWKVQPDKFKEELQKIKAYIATNNTYGVDLNPTAIELGKLSLWLNVIHKDMETPFFSNRLAVGNAVVGAWLKVYPVKEIEEELNSLGGQLKKQPNKEWWEKAPRQLAFKPTTDYDKIKHGRKPDEIYHFLLPDKNMVPSAGIKMLKAEYDTEARAVANWKRDWCKPLRKGEIEQLKLICNKIDELLAGYYQFQRSINLATANKQEIFGVPVKQTEAALRSYDEKERLTDQRNRHNAPYFKLKIVLDYWCSLWFWDVREAGQLPTRQQYWQDVAGILELDTNKALDGIIVRRGQQKLYETDVQLSLAMEPDPVTVPLTQPADNSALFTDAVVESSARTDLFDNNQRIKSVSRLAGQYHFFHPQLEFLEVFWERGGFDLIAGNPPWVKIEFEEKIPISEMNPEILVKDLTAPEIKKIVDNFLKEEKNKLFYINDFIETENLKCFTTSYQNYHYLGGQKSNLYKNFIINSLGLISSNGFIGLLHPESIYDDPYGYDTRVLTYTHLVNHFQFQNQLFLFAEVGHRFKFSINIYEGKASKPSFNSINNLFHPSTIDGCFVHDGKGICEGIKLKNPEGVFVWNQNPHRKRLIKYDEERLKIFSKIFANSEINWSGVQLAVVHTEDVLVSLQKIADFKTRVGNYSYISSIGWFETNDAKAGIIRRETKYPQNIESYELIYSGPHFFVSNPLYKTPREKCTEKSHYDVIDHNLMPVNYIPRTNYVPNIGLEQYYGHSKNKAFSKMDNMLNYYKAANSKMLNQAAERTLQTAIIPPNVGHIDGIYSVTFQEPLLLVEYTAICSTIIMDFFVKLTGANNLIDNTIKYFPLGLDDKFKYPLLFRTLILNCINESYSKLWDSCFNENYNNQAWSRIDNRLRPFQIFSSEWSADLPLKSNFERRWALVEIDVIMSLAFGITLDGLIQIYTSQFPVLFQNEDDTWYDTRGNIVFTCSKGLTGVGVDRPVWEQIRNLQPGETYEHTITKSELYHGKKITYHAPFDKCDRVEDYKVAWEFFNRVKASIQQSRLHLK